MTTDGGELARAFEAVGLWQLTICGPRTDGKWSVHAAMQSKDWMKRKTLTAPLTTDLPAALLNVVRQIESLLPRPPSSAGGSAAIADLDDLF